jgi:hypothetical protein
MEGSLDEQVAPVNETMCRTLDPAALYSSKSYDLHHPRQGDLGRRESFSERWEKVCKDRLPTEEYERGLAMCKDLEKQMENVMHKRGLEVLHAIEKAK